MPRVRFLESVYLVPYNHVFNYNDELDIEDENLVKQLTDNGYVDVLIEEDNQIKKTTRKRQSKKDEA